ncbi:MAG: hypothetical protein AAB408_01695 [Patescibacteria group bacterium]
MNHEIEVTNELLTTLPENKNIVIDTTGSVIYTGEAVRENLQRNSLVLYIEVNEKMKEDMFKRFLEFPKPLLWGDVYHILPNETKEAALERCYPLLLEYRSEKYKEYADVTLPFEKVRELTTAEELLSLIGNSL